MRVEEKPVIIFETEPPHPGCILEKYCEKNPPTGARESVGGPEGVGGRAAEVEETTERERLRVAIPMIESDRREERDIGKKE